MKEWRPIATVDVVLLTLEDKQLKVLLHKRPKEPFSGCWALPGGYVRPEQDAGTLEAAQRILADKGHLPSIYLEQLKTYSGAERDPRGWSLSVAYLALVPLSALQGIENEEDVALFPVDHLPNEAFDHAEIINDAVMRLRGKGAYSSLPAAMLEERFTLPELLNAYEVALGHEINQSSFRRKIFELGILEDTGETTGEFSKRPAKLYRMSEPASTFNRSLGTA